MKTLPGLVLLPSQLCTARLWQHQIEHLADRAEITVPELDGDTIAGIATAVLAAAPARFALAAHGMGGFVAFEILRQSPARVTRLALLGTLATADGPAQIERREGYSRLVASGRFAAVIEERIPMLLHPDHQSDPDLLAAARAMAYATGPARFLRQQRAIIGRIDSRPTLARIGCPTLVLAASHDAIASPATLRAVADAIPGAEYVVIEGAGHFAPLERPDAVTGALRGWLGADAAGAPGG
ncbi:MAG: alpha/beta fold hydrolase [Pseudomonadales bacterium]|nr:alpha/beta fold hydrolase [Pseudomonadales bacterium]